MPDTRFLNAPGFDTAERPTLRDRLRELRVDLLDQLAKSEQIETGWLHALADVEIVLAALDRQ